MGKYPHRKWWERWRHILVINPTPGRVPYDQEGAPTTSFSLRSKELGCASSTLTLRPPPMGRAPKTPGSESRQSLHSQDPPNYNKQTNKAVFHQLMRSCYGYAPGLNAEGAGKKPPISQAFLEKYPLANFERYYPSQTSALAPI